MPRLILLAFVFMSWLSLMLQPHPYRIHGFHETRELTADEASTVDENASTIIASCKQQQDMNTTKGTNCDSFMKYLGEKCEKFAQGLYYCTNQDMIDYISGVPFLESGKPTPAQISIQEEEQRRQQAQEEEKQRRQQELELQQQEHQKLQKKEERNARIVELMNYGCQTIERNSFNQTILWSCPNGTVATPP